MEIKIDKATLPEGGRKVKFKISEDVPWIEGLYLEEDECFFAGFEETGRDYSIFEVHEWEYL